MSPPALPSQPIKPLTWSPVTESNRRPSPYHGDALPTELTGPIWSCLPVRRRVRPAAPSGVGELSVLLPWSRPHRTAACAEAIRSAQRTAPGTAKPTPPAARRSRRRPRHRELLSTAKLLSAARAQHRTRSTALGQREGAVAARG